MNRLCERTSMRRNRRFVRTGMSAAQMGECPELGERSEWVRHRLADLALLLRLSLGRRDRTVAVDETTMLLFVHTGRVGIG
jgi:hypothetical protein